MRLYPFMKTQEGLSAYSHSMINAVLKHYKINKIELYLHVDTIQNTMVRKLGDCTDRVARRKTLLD